MLVLLSALTIATLLAAPLIRFIGRPAFGILALVPLAGFCWVIHLFLSGAFADGGELVSHFGWLTELHLDVNLRMDGLSALFSLIVLGVGALVLLYCWGYFDSAPPRLAVFGTNMMCFALAMFGLVLSDSLLLMYIFWEITSVLSFLLVGYYAERASSRRSAGQALLVTTLGGLAMLVGIVLFGTSTGVWTFSGIAQIDDISQVPAATAATVLLIAGALSKSAIAPTHFWLPGAMAAPTPVSAYLHAAAMVKAGVYLVARLAPDFAAVQAWTLVLIPLGIFTMLMGGLMALRQRDLKLILAYGTVSQLGFIIAVLAVGTREALLAGLALTVAHSLFKAALFMVVGAIDHCTGTRDITKLSGLGRRSPLVCGLAVLSAASMAGIPPLFGFVAKETALGSAFADGSLVGVPGYLFLLGIVVGSILTMAYSCFFLWAAFATKKDEDGRRRAEPSDAVAAMKPIRPLLWLSPLILTACTIAFGLYPHAVDSALSFHLNATFAQAAESHLELWHGFTLPLALSAVIITGGLVVYWQRAAVKRAQFAVPAMGSADQAYDAVLAGLRTASLRLTASTQRGSLIINVGIIFSVLVLLPLVALILGDRGGLRMELWSNPWQAIAASIIILAAAAATLVHNRLSGLILVGVTGYCLAMIFALHGAPDLALTQVLVETVSMVVFMLVLRKLPSDTEWRVAPTRNRARAWLSIAVGIAVVVLGAYAINARSAAPISELMPELAHEIGHGANTVNVLLVDIRAWDTFGEITVLVLAAAGVASLVYGTRTFTRGSKRPTLSTTGRRWLSTGADTERAQNRSLLVDVVTHVAFPAIMALSLYFFFAGHNAPGGGFAGGLVAGLALSLRYIAGGRDELEATLPVDSSRVIYFGLILAGIGAVWPMFFGRPPLTSTVWDLTLPLVGEMHVPSALLFDAGVYVIVVGVVLHILTSLGVRIDQDEDLRRQRARDRARAMARQRKTSSAATSSTAAPKATAQVPGGDEAASGGSGAPPPRSTPTSTAPGKEAPSW